MGNSPSSSLFYARDYYQRDGPVNYPIAQARGLQLRDNVPRRHQEEPHAVLSLPGSHREVG
jgi:hypothetical protein